ncbi:YbhB/YbcL family Raf kinase inhibitor-like protein [Halosegnis sp.]|uniref:YbhB/YbcL family Raf kinase inhibitor-like protein n=1 Tax=Halosegnis sp. TaxID=2864959 RepID=UPI0035D44B27
MPERRRVLAGLGAAVTAGFAGCGSASRTATPDALRFTVPALADGTVPTRLTCDGDGTSPRVEIDAVPPPTESIALIFTFPDDIASQVTLWTMWNVPPETETVPADVPATERVAALNGARQGRNARGDIGYLPVCPPPGRSYEHWFTLYACRRQLDLEAGASRDALAEELETATLASKRVVATYERSMNTTSS